MNPILTANSYSNYKHAGFHLSCTKYSRVEHIDSPLNMVKQAQYLHIFDSLTIIHAFSYHECKRLKGLLNYFHYRDELTCK